LWHSPLAAIGHLYLAGLRMNGQTTRRPERIAEALAIASLSFGSGQPANPV
jgi:hypothetical protein